MDAGVIITHGTAAAAFLAYVVALMVRLTEGSAHHRRSRLAWTAAWLMLAIHVACAFHFVHHWSHAHAWEATARQTADVTGVSSGAGIHVNYAVITVWLSDVAWWWLAPASYQGRPKQIGWLIHGFLVFVWFNATVVFGHGLIRWFAAAAFALLALALRRQHSKGSM